MNKILGRLLSACLCCGRPVEFSDSAGRFRKPCCATCNTVLLKLQKQGYKNAERDSVVDIAATIGPLGNVGLN